MNNSAFIIIMTMVSLQRLKDLINDPSLPDEEIKIIRDELYILADIICEYLSGQKKKHPATEKT